MINIENVLRAFFGFHLASTVFPFLPHLLDFDRVQDVQSNLNRLRWDKAASLARSIIAERLFVELFELLLEFLGWLLVVASLFLYFLLLFEKLMGSDGGQKCDHDDSNEVDERAEDESRQEPALNELLGLWDGQLGEGVDVAFVEVGIRATEVRQHDVRYDGKRPEDKHEEDQDAFKVQPSVKQNRLIVVFCQFLLAIDIIQIFILDSSIASSCLNVVRFRLLVVLHGLLFFVILLVFLVQEIHLSPEEAAASTGHWQGQK